MEDIYEKMNRWADEKAAHDDYFWSVAYPSMDVESKMVFWRKDVFNTLQKYGLEQIPQAWFDEKCQKEPDFLSIFPKIVEKLK